MTWPWAVQANGNAVDELVRAAVSATGEAPNRAVKRLGCSERVEYFFGAFKRFGNRYVDNKFFLYNNEYEYYDYCTSYVFSYLLIYLFIYLII